jgi:hypothetical protein
MNKRLLLVLAVLVLVMALFAGCGSTPADDAQARGNAPIEDGMYLADFSTDSTMFHVNEVKEGKGLLTVENGFMTIHIVMPSKNILNLYLGLAEDAQKEGAELINPTVDEVTYSDGLTEEVYAFDVPVPAIDEEFDLALIGTKGKWYDHKVKVSNPVSVTSSYLGVALQDGEYTIEVTMTGGSGRASIESPAKLTAENGEYKAEIVWSSEHYEYMIVNGTQYDKVNTEGNSRMIIPVELDKDMAVSALTTAMSEPHLVDYTLHFDSSTITEE